MPITEKQFVAAKPGDAFVDKLGREWVVEKVIEGGPFPALMTRLEGNGQEKLIWYERKIVDEEYAILVELNCPEARFEKKQ